MGQDQSRSSYIRHSSEDGKKKDPGKKSTNSDVAKAAYINKGYVDDENVHSKRQKFG